jgi:hypothetical protein
MNKKPLIIKNYSKLVAKKEYLLLYKNKNRYIISYKFINAIFISIKIKVSLTSLAMLANKFPLFLIDANGNIITKITKVKNENI